MILRYTRRAVRDLDQAYAFIALDNPAAARRVAASLRAAIEGLRQFPERGRIGRVTGTRELVVPRTPFIVAWRVAGDAIDVLAVIHAARSWPLS
jgi:addiction module RelE/StbE family toxin